MEKKKRIFALIAILLLAALYISTLVFAFIDTETSRTYLGMSLGGTIIVPIVLYGFALFNKHTSSKNKPLDDQESEDTTE